MNLVDSFDWHLFFSWKMFLIPAILLGIIFVEKKWGTVLGGALSGLPLVSGTVLCFAVFTQTQEDYSHSIYGALAGVISLSCMIFMYSKLVYYSTGGNGARLNRKERSLIYIKSLILYFVISSFFIFMQEKLNHMLDSSSFVAILFILACVLLNFILYKKLPKIRPNENVVNVKFKNYIIMSVIGMFTFSLLSCFAVYGANSTIIGLLSTAPVYLSVVVIMTHNTGNDYDVIHLNKGILVGFFGYILFFSTFFIGLTLAHLEPKIIVPAAILITISAYLVYALVFKKSNKAEVTRLSIQSLSNLLPTEDNLNNSLQQQLLANKEEGVEIKTNEIIPMSVPNPEEIKA